MTEGALHAAVVRSLPLWPVSPRTTVRMINRSENTTFRLDDPDGRRIALRVHRPGYNTRDAIGSELAWIMALRRDRVLLTPAPVAGRDGEWVQTVTSETGAHHAVAFEFVAGTEPQGDLTGWFHQLGGITARLHAHANAWSRPPGFSRRCWDVAAMFGPAPVWGSWRNAPGLDDAGAAVLARGEALIAHRLAAFGRGADRFGLIHADLRLTNLLVDGPRLHVIDFDDCGEGWFAYDFAAAISFFEESPEVPGLLESWLHGYRAVRRFPEEQVAMMPVLVAARRLLLTAWAASHPGAAPVGRDYTIGTIRMMQDVLSF